MDTDNVISILDSNGLKDIDVLLDNQSFIIMRNDEWYIPDGKVDKNRIIRQWNDLVSRCMNKGKDLRAFCMMDCFFDNDFAKEEVVDYEDTLPSQFKIPFISICVYMQKDLDALSLKEREKLVKGHSHIWIGNK